MNILDKIKICGVKEQEIIDFCVKSKIGFLGFNFVDKSPRYVTPEQSAILQKNIPASVKKIALIVDEADQVIADIIEKLQPDFLQLHGHETLQRVIEIKQKFNLPIIKAIPVADSQDIMNAVPYFAHIDMALFDAKPREGEVLTGGNGHRFQWSLIKNIPQLEQLGKPIMLAGGLNCHNLHQAQLQTSANYFDICSGVEEIRGVKSFKLIEELVEKYS